MTPLVHAGLPRLGVLPILLIQILMIPELFSQVAGFNAPDTVYTGQPVSITNTTTGGSTYYWNFCSGSANQDPSGENIGNPGNLLDIPTYITLVRQGTDCFSFVSCQGVGVIRYYHGSSFRNNPVSWKNLGTFGGTITFSEEGIQVKEDNGQWYGFVCSDTKLVRIDFGNSLWNNPTTATSLLIPGLNMLHGMVITREGTTWLGFAVCSLGNNLVRFNFGNGLSNTPVMTDFGTYPGFNSPRGLCLVEENSLWYGLTVTGTNALFRITFGNSLLNTPALTNLGNPGGFNSSIGITLVRDCETTTAYWVNYISPGQLGKLEFPGGIAGSTTGTVLGDVGGLMQPHSFSELFRQNDTLYAYVTNRGDFTLTRLTFPPCNNASVPSSTLFTPPPFSYNTPGTYNIRLIVNEGQTTQSTLCKRIVVIPPPAGIVAAFTAPDTVCTGTPVTITNQSTTGATCFWSFCSGNTLSDPSGVNIGNPGNLLGIPTYITLVRQGTDCFSFVSCQGVGVVRYFHGTSFNNSPVNWTNLGTFGAITFNQEGIQVKQDNGQWYGFVCSDTKLVRLDFGTSLWNTPTATSLTFSGLTMLHGLWILKEGTTWVGFGTCSIGNKMVRFNFGTSLLNSPVMTDFGTPGAMNMPGPFQLVQETGLWYGLVTNLGNSTMTRISFGSSLLNTPTGVNLGAPCAASNPMGLALIRDCDVTTGFLLNYSSTSPDLIWRLNFPSGITGPVTGTSLGNIGNLSRPGLFSELFRIGDTLFMYSTNRDDFTLTRFRFLPCTNASVPSSTLYTPPVFSYDQPGTYNIQLIVNEVMPDQASVCRQIVVIDKPAAKYIDTTLCYGTPWYAGGALQTKPGIYYDTIRVAAGCDSVIRTTLSYKPEIPVSLGNDTIICNGATIILHTGVAPASYHWQDGSPDSVYTVVTPGNYWVTVTKNGCSASDTIHIGECVSPLWFPNVFTPNGDNVNETFHAVGYGVLAYSILIYDRWGRKVFESNRMEPGWDGTIHGAKCSDGVYVFIATYQMDDSSGETYHAKGSVTLLR